MTLGMAHLIARLLREHDEYATALRERDLDRIGAREEMELHGHDIRSARVLEELGLVELWRNEGSRITWCKLRDFRLNPLPGEPVNA